METFEQFSLDIEVMNNGVSEVITSSSSDTDHDNGFIDWGDME